MPKKVTKRKSAKVVPPSKTDTLVINEPSLDCASEGPSLDNSCKSSKSKTSVTIDNILVAESLCCACRKIEPPDSIKHYKESPWIQCDLCRGWWHAECAFIDDKTIKKFSRYNISFTCALCVVENSPWIKIQRAAVGVNKSERFASNSSTLGTVERIPEDKQPVSPKPDVIVINKCESKERKEKLKDNTVTKRNIEQPGTLKPVKTTHIESANLVTDKNIPDNLVIIDGIEDPSAFQDSRIIKREIKKHKNIEVKYAYPLIRGGIAVHAKTTKDRENLLRDWPAGSFNTNSQTVSAHHQFDKYKCVLKNVSPYISEETLSNIISEQTDLKVHCRRLRYRDTNKPLQVVVITFNSNSDLVKIFTSNLVIAGKKITVQAYRNKRNIPTRCYNCQEFGHIARLCTKETFCENCGESRCVNSSCCRKAKKCFNCQGNHSAADPSCPAFVHLRDKLCKRK